MPTKSRTAVAIDLQIEAQKQSAIALGLESEGKHDKAEIHRMSAANFQEKATQRMTTWESPKIVMGEANTGGVIAWKPKNTLRVPEQVAIEASVERKELLLGPNVDVCAMALDTADSIEAANALEKMHAHQMALAHKLAFDYANKAAAQKDPAIAVKLMNLSARLMDTFQRGLLTIQKLRSGGTQTVTVQHAHVQGGQTVVAGTMQTGALPKPAGSADEK